MKGKRRIVQAAKSDREEIYALYKMQLGREYCAWNEHYPDYDTIDFDLERDALFVMKEEQEEAAAAVQGAAQNETTAAVQEAAQPAEQLHGALAGKIIAAISMDQDEQVEALPVWSKELSPGGEIARVAVHLDYQNQGLARIMMAYVMECWKQRGRKSAHFLINKSNVKALHSYEKLDFKCVGECEMYEQEFWCFEKKL